MTDELVPPTQPTDQRAPEEQVGCVGVVSDILRTFVSERLQMTNVSWRSLVTTNRNFDPFLHYSLYLFYVSIFYLLIMKILQK